MIFFYIVIINILGRLGGRIETGFYDAAMMRGATKWSYWMSSYINDVLVNMVPAPIIVLMLLVFDV